MNIWVGVSVGVKVNVNVKVNVKVNVDVLVNVGVLVNVDVLTNVYVEVGIGYALDTLVSEIFIIHILSIILNIANIIIFFIMI